METIIEVIGTVVIVLFAIILVFGFVGAIHEGIYSWRERTAISCRLSRIRALLTHGEIHSAISDLERIIVYLEEKQSIHSKEYRETED